MPTAAIIQSNYIPWKGYFDIIHDVDVFVFLDDVQFTVRDWRNRNLIKTPAGPQWLTIPVGHQRDRRICDVTIGDGGWAQRHWQTLCRFYARAPHFARYRDFCEELYLRRAWSNLSELNQYCIRRLASEFLGISAVFRDSREFQTAGAGQDRLLCILRQLGAGVYVSGPSAQQYIQRQAFADAGVELRYKDYAGYPEYPQLFGKFEHGVTVLDMLFNLGPEAPDYIWGWRNGGERR